MTGWPAYVEDALAFWFTKEAGNALKSVVIFEHLDDDERVVASWNYVARAPDSPSTFDIAEDVDWLSSGDRIGQWEVRVPDLFSDLNLHSEDLGECQRSGCEREAERYVLYTSAISKEAHTTADQPIQEVCERHEPSVCPFHSTDGEMSSAPGYGWKPRE